MQVRSSITNLIDGEDLVALFDPNSHLGLAESSWMPPSKGQIHPLATGEIKNPASTRPVFNNTDSVHLVHGPGSDAKAICLQVSRGTLSQGRW